MSLHESVMLEVTLRVDVPVEFFNGCAATFIESCPCEWWVINLLPNGEHGEIRATVEETDSHVWPRRVDWRSFADGFHRLSAPVKGLNEAKRFELLRWLVEGDAGMFDTDDVDILMQAHFFGEIRYS